MEMNVNDRSLVLPRQGSKVRLVGLKDPALNNQIGLVKKYSHDGERIKIVLSDGSEGPSTVRVKPKQIEVLEDVEEGFGGGPSPPGLHRRHSKKDKQGGEPDKVVKTGGDLVSREEFKHYVNRMIDGYFNTVDANGNGFIDKEEARNAAFLGERDAASALDARGAEEYKDIPRDDTESTVREGSSEGFQRRGSLREISDYEDGEWEDAEDDVYNMFFIADNGSASFWFGIFVFLMKMGLMLIIAIDAEQTRLPQKGEAGLLVKILQFFLLFVNVSFQEELMTTFFVCANLKWSKDIMKIHPGATKTKYHCANIMRFLDGIFFLVINTAVLFQATAPLGAMLNFAALMFLSQVDNQALILARNGYLAESMEYLAAEASLMKIPKNHQSCLQKMDSALLALVLFAEFVAWIVLVIL